MRIFVSAAEISSDLHAGKIVRALLEHHPEGSLELFGIGGPSLRSIDGFRTLVEAESLRAMGFTEVLSKLRELRRIREGVLAELVRNPPDVILTFDYPEFHLSLMEGIAGVPALAGALKICGIPPKVWVWRQHRVERIRRLYDGVWTILPFERDFYESRGIPVIYEGNPLIADLFQNGDPVKTPWLTPTSVRLAVMPGSREAELKQHLKVIPKSLQLLAELTGRVVQAEVPVPSGVGESLIRRELVSEGTVSYEFIRDGSREVLARNSIGLIKSGTSTLESAVLGCVPVIFYKVSPLSEFIFKFIVRYSGPVGLPNILLGAKRKIDAPFKEFLGVDATPQALAVELSRLVEDGSRRRELENRGASLKESLVPVNDVSRAVAAKISAWILKRPTPLRLAPRRKTIALLSWLWSTVNGLRRSAIEHGVGRLEPLP